MMVTKLSIFEYTPARWMEDDRFRHFEKYLLTIIKKHKIIHEDETITFGITGEFQEGNHFSVTDQHCDEYRNIHWKIIKDLYYEEKQTIYPR